MIISNYVMHVSAESKRTHRPEWKKTHTHPDIHINEHREFYMHTQTLRIREGEKIRTRKMMKCEIRAND